MKITAFLMFALFASWISYNSGFNQGHETAVKFDPQCRNGK